MPSPTTPSPTSAAIGVDTPSLGELLAGTPYVSYTYAYPHKTAYRPFSTPLPLDALWAEEKRDALFLYLHIPFCEMRCGFCNLFTTVDPARRLAADYLAALRRQAGQMQAALGDAAFARMAIGGGTPTYLSAAELDGLFTLARDHFGIDPTSLPTSVETSPLTAEPEKLHVLREHGVERISIGVQSFREDEARRAGRPQQTSVVERALDAIRALDFPTLNIDLIYGLPGQTVGSWLESLRAALRDAPEELYLYPLYVRPLTGLGRHATSADDASDIRLQCYREGRRLLLDAGYTQVSMRMFRAAHAAAQTGPVYCVQEDGMVGLGCGARSYTSACHYSNEYAVGAYGVRSILREYMGTAADAFAAATYGFHLDGDEQRRRYVIKSLLEADGLSRTVYAQRFGSDVLSDLPMLHDLIALGLAVQAHDTLHLTEAGVERSDTIGPWLYSPVVRASMEECVLR